MRHHLCILYLGARSVGGLKIAYPLIPFGTEDHEEAISNFANCRQT
jgi:hypothetical protein